MFYKNKQIWNDLIELDSYLKSVSETSYSVPFSKGCSIFYRIGLKTVARMNVDHKKSLFLKDNIEDFSIILFDTRGNAENTYYSYFEKESLKHNIMLTAKAIRDLPKLAKENDDIVKHIVDEISKCTSYHKHDVLIRDNFDTITFYNENSEEVLVIEKRLNHEHDFGITIKASINQKHNYFNRYSMSIDALIEYIKSEIYIYNCRSMTHSLTQLCVKMRPYFLVPDYDSLQNFIQDNKKEKEMFVSHSKYGMVRFYIEKKNSSLSTISNLIESYDIIIKDNREEGKYTFERMEFKGEVKLAKIINIINFVKENLSIQQIEELEPLEQEVDF